jgi:hypothetical protein
VLATVPVPASGPKPGTERRRQAPEAMRPAAGERRRQAAAAR